MAPALFLDPRPNATGPDPVPPFRRGCDFVAVFRRFARRFTDSSFSGVNIFGDHISLGVGFCPAVGYSAQRARPDARRLGR
jgi:hypothetical protein